MIIDFSRNNGGGGEYVLPKATETKLGGIKVGENLSIDGDGVLSAVGGGSSKALKPVTELPAVADNGTLVSLYQKNWNTIVSAIGMGNVLRHRFSAGYQLSNTLEHHFLVVTEGYSTKERFDNYHSDSLYYGFYAGSEEVPSEGHTLRIALNRLTDENYVNQILNNGDFWGCPFIRNEEPVVEIFGGEDVGFHNIYEFDNRWITLSGAEFMYDSSTSELIFRGDGLSWRNGTDEEAGRREYGSGSQKYIVWISFDGQTNAYESVPFENGQLGYIDTITFPVSVDEGIPYTFNVRMECYGEILSDGNYYITYKMFNADAPAERTNFERSAIYQFAGDSDNWVGYSHVEGESIYGVYQRQYEGWHAVGEGGQGGGVPKGDTFPENPQESDMFLKGNKLYVFTNNYKWFKATTKLDKDGECVFSFAEIPSYFDGTEAVITYKTTYGDEHIFEFRPNLGGQFDIYDNGEFSTSITPYGSGVTIASGIAQSRVRMLNEHSLIFTYSYKYHTITLTNDTINWWKPVDADSQQIVNIDEGSGVPRWDKEGRIVGMETTNKKSIKFNTTGYNRTLEVYAANIANIPAQIYVPSQGGTEGQVLMSKGDAEPTWINKSDVTNGVSFAKLTQDEYDALEVKDPNTLYIIIED